MSLENMLIIDLETGGLQPENGIFEVAVLAIQNSNIIDKLHLGIVYDPDLIHLGYGAGYELISSNETCIQTFKEFLSKYPYPLVAHNGSFDRKFLLFYEWIPEHYPFFDSVRAFRLKMPGLFSYSLSTLIDFFELEVKLRHTAMADVEVLYQLIQTIQPEIWIPIGEKISSSKGGKSHSKNLTSLKTEFELIKDIFNGKNIVFTGKGPFVRNDLMQLAKKCGADVSSNSITKKTNLLVVGADAGSKLQKAKDLGIEIMDMADFFEMTSGIEIEKTLPDSLPVTPNTAVAIESGPISEAFKNEFISFVPMRAAMAEKLSNLIKQHSGDANTRISKKTTILVYQLSFYSTEDDYASIEKAKSQGIPVYTLGQFNRIYLDRINK